MAALQLDYRVRAHVFTIVLVIGDYVLTVFVLFFFL